MKYSAGVFALGLLSFASVASAADMYVLVHPKGIVDPDQLKVVEGKARSSVYLSISYARPKVVSGTDPVEVKPTGESYVIEFPPAVLTPIKRQTMGTPVGGGAPRLIAHTDVHFAQPFRVWYFKDATARPELLGESFEIGSETQLQGQGGDVFVVLPDTPAELAARKFPDTHSELARHVHAAVAAKIIATRQIPRLTPGDCSKVALNPGVGPARLNAMQEGLRTRFKPGKITAGPNGAVTAEVELHNRLPVPAEGVLSWMMPPGQPTLGTAEFKLAAGEKATVKIQGQNAAPGARLAEVSTVELTDLRLDKTKIK
jgi:hypothetical protein